MVGTVTWTLAIAFQPLKSRSHEILVTIPETLAYTTARAEWHASLFHCSQHEDMWHAGNQRRQVTVRLRRLQLVIACQSPVLSCVMSSLSLQQTQKEFETLPRAPILAPNPATWGIHTSFIISTMTGGGGQWRRHNAGMCRNPVGFIHRKY
jgi:hypothetical protein